MGKNKNDTKGNRKTVIKQTDVPSYKIEEALSIARTLHDNFASKSATPLRIAASLNVQPSSGPFRMLCGASSAYGLTKGSYNSKEISITELGKRITRPLEEGDDLEAKREALLKPRVVGEFLVKYSGSPIPHKDIATNVLADIGVPRDRTEKVLRLIIESADAVGLLRKIKDKQYVDLTGVVPVPEEEEVGVGANTTAPPRTEDSAKDSATPAGVNDPQVHGTPRQVDGRSKRVFISHGQNKQFLGPIKKLLQFGELEPVVSVERTSVSQPVPDKVMGDMRSCGAAIIHVDDELKLMDSKTNEHVVLNANVLMEIGAAIALYGRRFILLVKEGIKLPSNLQGLFEVRYTGESLDGEVTIKLLEAINDIKNHTLPEVSR